MHTHTLTMTFMSIGIGTHCTHMQQKHTVQVSELAACATPNTWRGNKPSH